MKMLNISCGDHLRLILGIMVSLTQVPGQLSPMSSAKTAEAWYLCGLSVSMVSINVELRGFLKFDLLSLNRCSRHCSINLLELSESQSMLRSLIIIKSEEANSELSCAMISKSSKYAETGNTHQQWSCACQNILIFLET